MSPATNPQQIETTGLFLQLFMGLQGSSCVYFKRYHYHMSYHTDISGHAWHRTLISVFCFVFLPSFELLWP